MASDGDADQQRIAEIRNELRERFEELDRLEARARARAEATAQLTPEERRRRFTIINGSSGAVALPAGISALARYRPRHPVAVAGALAAAAAVALALTVPSGGTAPPVRPGALLSASVSQLTQTPATVAVSPTAGGHGRGATGRSSWSLASSPASRMRPTPTSSSTAPSTIAGTPSTLPFGSTPQPSSSVACLVSANVSDVLELCLG